MSSATLEFASPHAQRQAAQETGELGLALQEAFTVAVRLRANRQVAADAGSFREHVRHLLAAADRDARSAGYDPEYVRLGVYAFIAFLDESVLNSPQPMFADWSRQPLQEEVFGDHMAGETFFRHVDELMARHDSAQAADALEVHLLCLLLGFRGRYGAGNPAALHGTIGSIQEKIRRCRGGAAPLSSHWQPPDDVIPSARDPWVKRLAIGVLVLIVVAALLYAGYRMGLSGGVSELEAQAARITGASAPR